MLALAARIAISLTPESLGCAIAAALATRTRRLPATQTQRAAMTKARPLRYGAKRLHAAWSWGEGPIVVLVHGWGGSAAQMAPLAARIATRGFQSVAIDVTGHGGSPESRTRWEWFLRDIAEASHALGGNLHAAIGHSAGGLALMAARGLKGLRASRYVCVCAPSHPFPPVRAIQDRLDPRPGVIQRYKDYLARQFESDWNTLKEGRSFAGASADTLLVYDLKDRYVPHSEGDHIKGLCPAARLVKTRDYGHTRILEAPELADIVGGFLREPSPT
jgi:pimeloyl-ACP methyl ester carboxylesterase